MRYALSGRPRSMTMLNPAIIRLASVRTSAILAMGAYLWRLMMRTAAEIAMPAWLSPMKKMKLTM